MSLGVATHQVGAYKVSTPVYEGPLDLLLQLIERAELDITRLALAQVTEQYLVHLRSMKERSPQDVSAFLVVAARLLQIKSEALLPRPPVREVGEEDPAEALTRQLLAYKRYKEIAQTLNARESAGLRTYLRLAPPPKVQGVVDLSEYTLHDLVNAVQSAFVQADNRPALNTVVAAHRITIRDRIRHIVGKFKNTQHTTFSRLLGVRHTRMEVVVTFLAMLELVKRRYLNAQQEALFGDIELVPAEEWDDDPEFEIEFGE
ncbi:segregation and condensation protein A [Chloroflexota bacterium]